MDKPGGQTQATADASWSALSPWAVIYFSANSIRQILTNSFTLAPIALGLLRADGLFVPAVIAALSILGIVLHACLVVRRFRYQVHDHRMKVRQGILNVAQIDLDFSRIQNVSIVNPFYFRPLGLVTLTIESAGSSDEEVVLAALAADRAEQLRSAISQVQEVSTAGTRVIEADSTVVLTRATRDLVIHGLSSNQAWLVLAGFVGVYSQAPDSWQLDGDALLATLPPGFLDSTAVQISLLVLVLIMLGIGLMLALSVLASLLIYGNFELRRVRDGFAARQGAISSRQLNVRQRRIQTVVLRQNWIAKFFARFNVSFEQISHGQADGAGAGRLLIPAVTLAQADELAATALDSPPLAIACQPFVRVSAYYLRKRFFWLSANFIVAGVMCSVFLPLWGLGPLSLIMLLVGYAQYQQWRILGLSINGDYLIVRRGLIGRSYVVLPISKVQRVALVQTPFMRRQSVIHVRLVLASRVVFLPCLPATLAQQIANYTLYKVEETPKSWM